MKCSLFLVALVPLMIGCSNPQHDHSGEKVQTLEQISNEFVNPQASFKPDAFWCWLNGNMSGASISRDLEAMKSKGISRAEIWDVAAIRDPSFISAGGTFPGDESP